MTSRAKRVVKQHQDLVLSNEAFDPFIAELDGPGQPVPELVELFKKNPKPRQACAARGCRSSGSVRTTT